MTLTIKDWKPIDKDILKAVFTLRINEWRLEVKGMAFFEQNGKSWVAFPGEKFADNEGKKGYRYWVTMDKPLRDKLFESILLEISKICPQKNIMW